MENHLKTIMIMGIAALLSWNVYTTHTSAVIVSNVQGQLTSLVKQIEKLETQISEISRSEYSAIDAAKDFTRVNSRVDRVEARLKDLEDAQKAPRLR